MAEVTETLRVELPKLVQVPVDDVLPNPNEFRKSYDQSSLEDLALSIKTAGVLQPVLVYMNDAGQLVLIAGGRRLKAAQMAGLSEIPAIIISEKDHAIKGLLENLQRADLNPVELAEALRKLIGSRGWTQRELAFYLGKKESTISETLTILNLPEKVLDEARTNPKCSRRALLAKKKALESEASGKTRKSKPEPSLLMTLQATLEVLKKADDGTGTEEDAGKLLPLLKEINRRVGELITEYEL
jgi:ParB family transcriptional regulator, chromosome partitioning protein